MVDPHACLVEEESRGHRRSLLPHQPLFWRRGPLVVVRVLDEVVSLYADIDLDAVFYRDGGRLARTDTAPRQLSQLPDNVQRSLRANRGKTWLQREDRYSVQDTPVQVREERTIRVTGTTTIAVLAASLTRELIPFSVQPSGITGDSREVGVQTVAQFTVPRDTLPQVLQMMRAAVTWGLIDVT